MVGTAVEVNSESEHVCKSRKGLSVCRSLAADHKGLDVGTSAQAAAVIIIMLAKGKHVFL